MNLVARRILAALLVLPLVGAVLPDERQDAAASTSTPLTPATSQAAPRD